MNAIKLKRVYIKEEIFALTQDTFEAIILGQLIYWQERVRDFDDFIEEEKERRLNDGSNLDLEPQNGWIYKSCKDLIYDCMLTISTTSMRRYLQKLIDKGFIQERKNSEHKWDKILQYRVNLDFVITEIKKLGYDGLSGYKLSCNQNVSSNIQIERSSFQNELAIPESINRDIKENIYKEKDDVDLFGNSIKKQNEDKNKDIDNFVNEIYDLYPKKCPVRGVSTGKCSKDKEKIKKLLKIYTQDEIYSVVKSEVNTKLGKTMIKNFGTFLNNFPDPKELNIVPTNGEYKPYSDNGDVFFNKRLNCYSSISDPCNFVNDGYTKDNRPRGAKLAYQMFMCIWDYDNKEWKKESLNK